MDDPDTYRQVPGAVKYINIPKNKAVWLKAMHDVFQFYDQNWKGPATGTHKTKDGIVDGAPPYFRKIRQSDYSIFAMWPDHLMVTMWIVLLEDQTNGTLVIAVVRAGVKPALTIYPQGLKFTGLLISAPSQLPGFIEQNNLHDPHNTGAWSPHEHNADADTIVIYPN
jgi:hypothetical protein